MSNISTDQILADCRAEIDALDETLIKTLAARFSVVKKVAQLKQQHAISVVQPGRMQQVLDNAAQHATQHGLDPAFARSILAACIDHAHVKEKEWMQ